MTYDATVLANSSLIHYYKLDETLGHVAADSKGSLAGTITGGVTLNQAGYVDGDPAFAFDGSSGEIDFTGLLLPASGAWSVDFWFNPTAFGGTLVKMSDRNEVYYSSDGELRMSRPNEGGGLFCIIANIGETVLGQWYYCAVGFDGFATLCVAVYAASGTFISGGGTGGHGSPTGTTPTIGHGTNGFFRGLVQKFGVYTTACGSNNAGVYVPFVAGDSKCASSYSLPETGIVDIDTDAKGLAARTHRQSASAEQEIELWYYRDGAWHLFPIQPLTGPDQGIEHTQVYKQPATLGFSLPDPFGLYAPENLNSAYNLNQAGGYDPLLDEARKILLRVGTHCYTNLAAGIAPTSSLAPLGGSLSLLTDGEWGDIANSIGGYVSFTPVDTSPVTITVDLGSVQALRHCVIRFATHIADGVSLPASVQIGISSDGSSYADYPVRPIGGDGGDWDESSPGQTIDCAFCDLERSGRYVRFVITPTGAEEIMIDELAVYGGSTFAVLGCNRFTGYLGDQIDFTPEGKIQCTAVDVLKRLADNNDTFLTAAYRLTSAGGIELADISHSLLTSSAYWKGLSDYDTPFRSSEIAWTSGSNLTGLQYPLWQGQTNSLLGYNQELWNTIGWHFYADGNGVLVAEEPPSKQRVPDRVCIAAPDGNYDAWGCKRRRTGKQMRNKVIVQTGKSKASGSGTITLFDPNSIARFGTRTTRITDPLAGTAQLRQKVASYFLRDYAWNLQTLNNTIRPGYNTKLKQIFGFRAPARPNLYAKASSVSGDLRKQELWSLVSLRHNITHGAWTAEAEWIPYVPQPTDAPNFTALNTVSGHTDEMSVVFDAITDTDVQSVRVYLSTTSEFSGFSVVQTVGPSDTPVLLTGLTPGNQTWVYLTSVDNAGNESIPSQILSGIPGSSSQSLTCYTITDFSVSSTLTEGPDSQGYYTYSFLCLWTSPLCGFTQSWIGAFVGGSPPSDPDKMSSWPLHDDSWDWWGPDRIADGRTWDNVTPGQLDFVINFRTTTNLSGLRIYFRIWNSARTRAWIPVEGNYSFCTVM